MIILIEEERDEYQSLRKPIKKLLDQLQWSQADKDNYLLHPIRIATFEMRQKVTKVIENQLKKINQNKSKKYKKFHDKLYDNLYAGLVRKELYDKTIEQGEEHSQRDIKDIRENDHIMLHADKNVLRNQMKTSGPKLIKKKFFLKSGKQTVDHNLALQELRPSCPNYKTIDGIQYTKNYRSVKTTCGHRTKQGKGVNTFEWCSKCDANLLYGMFYRHLSFKGLPSYEFLKEFDVFAQEYIKDWKRIIMSNRKVIIENIRKEWNVPENSDINEWFKI